MKIMIVYDSTTGNTEKMAKAIAEGASAGGASVGVKKIGESFPLSTLEKADGALFGSPCIYANVTPTMRDFLENMVEAVKDEKIKLKGKKAAVFGSYGWDGAWVMEKRLKEYVMSIGYILEQKACVEVGDNLKYNPDDHLGKCREWGKNFAESL